MAGKIHILSDEIIGRIAAGEVVERPAAAIKEMVENSLDAGASAITVEIRDGGISYFRVTDNGSGIEQSEIRMAFERHATSKISSSDDLHAIATLGFRGEALASIAAVSKVTCSTRTKEDQCGIRIQNDGGRIVGIDEVACPEGTTFVVKDLFFNTPVRLKFLKKPATEASLVADYVMRFILSRPDVSFRYISQGKTLYHSVGDGKLESAVFSVYGNELQKTMRAIDGHQAGIILHGYVGIGESGRSNRNNQSFFINGRYMRSQILSNAVETACKERVMIGKYPTCVLHLTIPYDQVDVNVHPNKLEVRFQNETEVAESVEQIVREDITDTSAFSRPVEMKLTPEPLSVQHTVMVDKSTQIENIQSPAEKKATVSPSPSTAITKQPVLPTVPKFPVKESEQHHLVLHDGCKATNLQKNWLNTIPVQKPQQVSFTEEQKEIKQEKIEQVSSILTDVPKQMKQLGVLFDTYILIEYDDQLMMVDQHALHERLNYQKMMKAYDQQTIAQELLVPVVVGVTVHEQMLIEENRQLLESIGFQVEAFGQTEVAIRTVPMILGEPQARLFFHEVLDQLEKDHSLQNLDRRRNQILQSACKHAIKGGQKVPESVLRDLIKQMVEQKVTPTCPHGRPLVVSISHLQLDKRFKRIQN